MRRYQMEQKWETEPNAPWRPTIGDDYKPVISFSRLDAETIKNNWKRDAGYEKRVFAHLPRVRCVFSEPVEIFEPHYIVIDSNTPGIIVGLADGGYLVEWSGAGFAVWMEESQIRHV